MPARRYRFHCTDGWHAVFDRTGRLVQRQRELRAHAEAVAHGLMASGYVDVDWSDWAVDVYDPTGRRCMTLPFIDILHGGQPRFPPSKGFKVRATPSQR